MPGVRQVHQNAVLTNVAIGYHPTGFIAEQIFPVLQIQKESDKYYIWNRHEPFRRENTLRADGAESNEVGFSLDYSTYQAEEYALKVGVTDRQKANADSVLRLKIAKTQRMAEKLLVDLEYRIATLIQTQANWASTNRVQLSGTNQFNNASFDSDGVTCSIEYRIDTAKEAVRTQIGREPNVIIIPSAVAKVVKRDAEIRNLIKYTHADLLVDGDLPPTLWNLKVIIPKATYCSTVEGAATQTMADIWGKHMILLYANPNAAIDDVSAGYIFRSRNWQTKEWREEEKSRDVVETGYIEDEKIVSNVAGYLIEDCIA
ncbi:MAG: hypothetical protein COX19_10775 [Desulfobacterales bacterium CG23_combo_of_CG06-09_8_20_14_all_51_8]|nr:MAG: hypothetical protein COX19_10775 [Desulfobacterales bacterium CG23_combo_of_CG06-09_8_20_14_all_51_8]